MRTSSFSHASRTSSRARRFTWFVWLVVLIGGPLSLFVAKAQAGTEGGGESGRVLILDATVSGGASSIEATHAASLGFAVDVVDDATWGGMDAAAFGSYRAIILGDAHCSSTSSTPVQAAEENAEIWGGAVDGNVIAIGTDPTFHQGQGGAQLVQSGIDFALADETKTGAYITLSCYYHFAAPNTP